MVTSSTFEMNAQQPQEGRKMGIALAIIALVIGVLTIFFFGGWHTTKALTPNDDGDEALADLDEQPDLWPKNRP